MSHKETELSLEGLIRKYAPTAEQSYYLKGQKPFYAIAEEDIPKLLADTKDLFNELVGEDYKPEADGFVAWRDPNEVLAEIRQRIKEL